MDALEQLARDQRTRWEAGSELAIEQSRRELSKPLDLAALFDRVDERVARHAQGK